MKIFAFSGVNRSQNSTTNYVLEQLIVEIEKRLDFKETSHFFTYSDDLTINYVQDSSAFFTGEDPIDDSMKILREEMLSADVILLGSPVYLHAVSGLMKTFIDRISYWAHIIKLAGKCCITVTVADSNGADEVSDYLNFVAQQQGMALIDSIKVNSGLQSAEAISSQVHVAVKRLKKCLDTKSFPITKLQEDKFKTYSKIYSSSKSIPNEAKIWKESNYFDYATYASLFESKVSKEILK